MRWWCSVLLAGVGACSSEPTRVLDHRSGTTNEPDAGPPAAADASAPADASSSGDASADDAGPAGPVRPCPAPPATGAEKEIFGDAATTGWSVNGFHREVTMGSPACSGAVSVGYSSHQYDGLGFYANDGANEIDAQALEFRIWIDRDAVVSAAAAPGNPPNDIHQYFLATQSEWSWKKGWNEARFTIPASYGKTGQVLFEVQSCSAPACDANVSIDLRIDDLRLVTR